MYDVKDPRASLASSTASTSASGSKGIALPQFFDFSRTAPDAETTSGGRTWTVRGQNMQIAYTKPSVGQSIFTGAATGEVALILPDAESGIRVTVGDSSGTAHGPALVVLAPGSITVTATGAGDIALISEAAEPNWPTPARNSESYSSPHPRVSPLVRWPEPTVDETIRIYDLDDVAEDSSRFGRIFRTRSFMINFLLPNQGPRDPSALSPHHHDDFEQASLAISGEFVHHIRTPWVSDRRQWREDDHEFVGSPSVAIIPPPTVHTTEPTGAGTNFLIDIFSPPREDFSDKPGWVLNESDYPRPDASVHA